jgi:hypothetical protein
LFLANTADVIAVQTTLSHHLLRHNAAFIHPPLHGTSDRADELCNFELQLEQGVRSWHTKLHYFQRHQHGHSIVFISAIVIIITNNTITRTPVNSAMITTFNQPDRPAARKTAS